jgi:hypothetical protein
MNTQEIKRGEYNAYYPISDLKMATVNRDTVTKHAENFKSKLNDYGWMMPIVVSSKGDVIEGHHRIESAKLLKQKTIPAYIIEWVNTDKDKEHLNAIISLNNGNKKWNTLDYLKAFARGNEDYKIVYDAYLSNYNNISVGNVVNCFFSRGRATHLEFKKGEAKIIDLEFSLYLIKKISELSSEFGRKKIQAYCVREMITVAFSSAKRDIKTMDFLFKKYKKLAKDKVPVISSLTDFKPTMELYKLMYDKQNKK